MEGKVFSFDVFDTVLARNVQDPKDVFTLIQGQLRIAVPDLPTGLVSSYRAARILAEFRARRLSSRDDIHLSDIYTVLQNWYRLSSIQIEELMLLEMAVEEKVLVPINGASAYLESKRREGKVVFISDMYLPKYFIEKVLIKFDLARVGESLYVSGEYGLTKGSGRLYKQVLSDCSIPPSSLTHFGDNPASDMLVPKGMGIQFDAKIGVPVHNPSQLYRLIARGKYLLELTLSGLQLVKGLYV